MTPLHWAAKVQDVEILQLLLDFGAEVDLQDFEGATPLHIASDTDSFDCVETLIAHGANPNIRNEFGVKASELMRKRGHERALTSPKKYPEEIRA